MVRLAGSRMELVEVLSQNEGIVAEFPDGNARRVDIAVVLADAVAGPLMEGKPSAAKISNVALSDKARSW